MLETYTRLQIEKGKSRHGREKEQPTMSRFYWELVLTAI